MVKNCFKCTELKEINFVNKEGMGKPKKLSVLSNNGFQPFTGFIRFVCIYIRSALWLQTYCAVTPCFSYSCQSTAGPSRKSNIITAEVQVSLALLGQSFTKYPGISYKMI